MNEGLGRKDRRRERRGERRGEGRGGGGGEGREEGEGGCVNLLSITLHNSVRITASKDYPH
jgi:hypothetical protein